MVGSRFDLAVIKQAFENNPTSDMGQRLMELAVIYKNKNASPHVKDAEIELFLKEFGHRGTIEMDIGVERWYENPAYIIEMIQSYMEGDPETMLASYHQKKKDAEALILEIYDRLLPKIGQRKASKVKSKLELYRHLVGMREQPKFDMIRGYKLIRMMLKTVGKDLVNQGRLKDPMDVFFLYMKDIEIKRVTLYNWP